MFCFFYNLDLDSQKDFKEIKKNITPAQLNKILLDNFNNSNNAIQEINSFIHF